MPVNVLRSRPGWAFAAGPALLLVGIAATLSGCAVHLTGMVRDDAAGLHLQTPEGKELRLVLDDASAPIAHLDDLIVDVSGRRKGRALTIEEWTVREGAHGLPTWVGRLERRGEHIGLYDRNSGAFYFVSPSVHDALSPYVGRQILLEGYVEGTHRVKVLYHRLLDTPQGDDA